MQSELPLFERDGAGDGPIGLGVAARLQRLELPRHTTCCPMALMLATAGHCEQLGSRVGESPADDAPKGRVADDDAVLPTIGTQCPGGLVSLAGPDVSRLPIRIQMSAGRCRWLSE